MKSIKLNILDLKKILILAYFFPPSNFVGGKRIELWVKYFHKNGYYPIIVTRQWNNNQTSLVEKITNNTLIIERHDTHEIHRLPYRRSFRDKMTKYKFLKLLQKTLTFLELVLSNFSISVLQYSNFYHHSLELLKKNDIKFLIASGRPFHLFHIGFNLKNHYPNIHWIPDYRDEWTSHEKYPKNNFLQKTLHSLECRSEKKWTSNATKYISVSSYLCNNIGGLVKKPSIVIPNGFHTEKSIPSSIYPNLLDEYITMSYFGTIYPYQPIGKLINTLKKLIDIHSTKYHFNIQFFGIDTIPQEEKKIKGYCTDYKENFHFFKRLPQAKLKTHYETSNFLLLTNYDDINEWLVAKVFDYAISGKPILYYPSDNGIMTSFIEKTNTGYIFKNENEFLMFFDEFLKNSSCKKYKKVINKEELNKFSVKSLTKNLVDHLDLID